MNRITRTLASLLLLPVLLAACGQQSGESPGQPTEELTGQTSEQPATTPPPSDGTSDGDPYLWLEEIEGEQVDAWINAENEKTLARLSSDPRFEELKAQFRTVFDAENRLPGMMDLRQYRGQIYRLQTAPDRPRGRLVRTSLTNFASDTPEWEVLIDVDAIAAEDGRNWYLPMTQLIFSPSADRVLVPLSDGGSDAIALREYDLVAREFVGDGFETPVRRHMAVWEDEDTLLVATPLTEEEHTTSAYPRHVRRWSRGTTLESAPIIFSVEREDMLAAPVLFESASMRQPLLVGARSFAEVHAYTWNDAQELLELKIPVALMDAFSGLTGVGTQATLLLQHDWNVSGETFPSGARVAVDLARVIQQGGQPEGAVSLVYMPKENESLAGLFGSFTAAGNAIYLNVIEDVKSRIRRVAPAADGSWEVTALPLPGDGAASLALVADPYTESFLLRYENFLTPPALYRVDEGQSLQLVSQEQSDIDLSGYVTEQFFAQASDGTSIPYFITRAIDRKPETSAPVLMYAYGGFGIPVIQNYELFYIGPTHRIWLEQGGVFVLANPRGGGEYGPRWHQAAKRTTRQIVYDDIYAVAEDVIKRGFSSPGRFGFIGGSNGGLTAGVVATQRPDLFGASISLTPLLDMERYHLLLSGASWMDEYGNPDDPVEGPALLAYSPYHNLKPAVSYPEIFLLTSTRDDRVHPGHARKMANKMQDMGHEVLFYEAREGGHAMAVNNEGRAFNAAMQAVYLMQKLME